MVAEIKSKKAPILKIVKRLFRCMYIVFIGIGIVLAIKVLIVFLLQRADAQMLVTFALIGGTALGSLIWDMSA